MKLSVERILELSNAFGPSGFEDEVVEQIRGYLKNTSYALTEDTLRNLYVKKEKKDALRVMLDAHTDEVGFMVQSLLPQGTMRLAPIGGWGPLQVSSLRLVAKNHEGERIPGIVASRPPHFGADPDRTPELSQMTFDVGARDMQELKESFGIGLATPLVPHVQSRFDEKRGLLYGKAFDCRIGCAALVETLLRLDEKDAAFELVATFSSQEETGLRGTTITAPQIKPDIAIVFEGAPADDTFPVDQVQCAIGKGPMLRHMDKSMITHPRFQRFALDVAKKEGIPHQEAVRLGGGTNAAVIHLTNRGVPTIVLGVPVRYIHSGEGIARLSDVEDTVRLALAILDQITEETIRTW